jgi:DNA-binding GntR family transcriptional regulator
MKGVKTIQPLPAVTRRTQVVDVLRDAILSGALLPGTRVTEQDLAARLRVSRGPIREAIRELINDGLLESQPYSGTYVSVMDGQAIIAAYGLRRVLEKYAITLVWPRRDAEFKIGLVRKYEALLAAAKSGNVASELAAEMEFHGFPCAFSKDKLLLTTWHHVTRRMQIGFILHRTSPESPGAVKMHEPYLASALGDNLDRMLAEIDSHLDLGLKLMHPLFAASDVARA